MPKNTLRENDQLTFTFDDRHWRVRGLEKQLSCERMKVNLMVTRRELVHVDTLDLYTSRMRRTFVKEAAAELLVEEAVIKKDLGHVLLELESLQDTLIRDTLTPHGNEVPVMTDAERAEAIELLEDPRLLDRILADYDTCGLVGEEPNKLLCYLACVSRLMARPLSVLIQSSSASGKTALLEGTLGFMPPEELVRFSAMTGQSLYYMGRDQLKHKILAVAEEEGVADAGYALKLLQSEGRIAIACAGKESHSGRQQTQLYEVEGPVAMLLTTTVERSDEELANRCITLSVNEQAPQTASIHSRQRAAYLPAASNGTDQVTSHAVQQRHQNAQRLLEPLQVVIPFAEQLTFRTDQIRYRRDHAKYLTLIASVTLLHQYQRQRTSRSGQSCVVATLDDARIANRLAGATFGIRVDELLPQTRQLFVQLSEYVTRRAQEEDLRCVDVRFTQRELRETLHWSDRALRRQLKRLVELEYVLVYRTGRGNQRAYQLLQDAQACDAAAWQLGLSDLD